MLGEMSNAYPQTPRDATGQFIPSALTVRREQERPDAVRLSHQKALALSASHEAMRDRLRAKNRQELQLSQQLQTSRSNKVVLQNQVDLERQNRDLLERELRDVQTQLGSLRERYDEKSKKEIDALKKLGKAEIELKDTATRLADATEAEGRSRRAAEQLRTRAARLEKDLFQVRFEHSNLTNALGNEQRVANGLRENMEKQTDEYLAETQALRVERASLTKRLAASEKELAHLQAQLATAEEQIEDLTAKMHLGDEEHLKEVHSLGQRLRDSEDANKDLASRADRTSQHVALLEQQLEDERHRGLDLEQHLNNQRQVESELHKVANALRAQVKVMDERLSDKTRSASALQETAEMARSDAAVLQTRQEQLRGALTESEAKANQEAAERAALEQKLADAQEAEQRTAARLEAMTDAEERATQELLVVTAAKNAAEVEAAGLHTRLAQVQQELAAAADNAGRLEKLVEARDADVDRLFVEKKAQAAEHDYYTHGTELRMRDLENQVQAQAEVVERQAAALEQAERREATARAANLQLQEDANDVHQRLQAKLGTVETQLQLVASELRDAQEGMAVLKQDLDREIDTTGQLRQKNAALEHEKLEAARTAAERASKLEVALAREAQAREQLAEDKEELLQAVDKLQQQVARAAAAQEAQRQQLNEATLRASSLEEQVASAQEQLQQRADQAADLQRSVALLQERLDAKSDAEAHSNRTNAEIQSDLEVLQQKLADAQAAAGQLEEELSLERANGAKLEEAMQANEEQHQKDAHAVKLTILGLQRTLMDKANQAERLAMQVEAVRKKSLEYESLIDLAKTAAEEARQQADYRTAQLSAENSELSLAIDAINNDIASLRDQLQRSQERNAALASANKDLKGTLEIARDGEAAKDEQTKSLDDALQQRMAKEKELQTALDEKVAALDEARYELREAGSRIDYQKGRIAQLEDEVVTAQQQLRDRQRVERRLLSQLEAGAPGSVPPGQAGAAGAGGDDAAELAAASPRGLRQRLAESEAHRAELSRRLMDILRRENSGPDVP